MMNLQQIESEALHLPEPERAELAQKLFHSLDAHTEQESISIDWLLDARRRAEDLDRGIVQPISSEEVSRKALDITFLQGLEGTLGEWASEADEEAWRAL